MTDKATVEISSPKAGAVNRIHFLAGQTIQVGEILVEIDDGNGKNPTEITLKPLQNKSKKHRIKKIKETSKSQLPPILNRPTSPLTKEKKLKAVPAVRELAKKLNVNLNKVKGTGPGGRIMRADVESFIQKQPTKINNKEQPKKEDPEDWTRFAIIGLRRQISNRMVESKSHIPHFTYVEEIDMTNIEKSRQKTTSPLAIIAHAVCHTLPQYPILNASLDEDSFEVILKRKIHLGIATATDDGLIVPIIRDADLLSVKDLATAISSLSDKSKRKKLTPSELRGSTFTITSLGKLGGIMATPIINYPEAAILSVHRIRLLPRVIDDKLKIRHVMNLSISLDHRIIDGLIGAEFMQTVKEYLESHDYSP